MQKGMQKGHRLHFKCQSCKEPVFFSVFDLEKGQHTLTCEHCQNQYVFGDEALIRQIKKFDTLCRTICDSEEILSRAAVGVDVGHHHVKVPYKLLLARLSSSLDLKIGNETVSIIFRIEPIKDVPQLSQKEVNAHGK